jgi:uncharacterized protein (TIGR02145 family)
MQISGLKIKQGLMKTKIFLTISAFAVILSTFGQRSTIEVNFTAIDSASYVQLDSIKVMNRTQGGNTMLYWPDTTLMLDITLGDELLYIGYSTKYPPVGIANINKNRNDFQLFQNYPNPLNDHTLVSLYIPEKGTMSIRVLDMAGRNVVGGKWLMEKGYHSFRFSPGNGNLFFFIAQWNGISKSIKILTTETNTGNTCSLEYLRSDERELQLKASSVEQGFVQESGILDFPTTNETKIFQFATNIPCLGTPIVAYGGQVYSTIQICSQCWLKENLNVGTMIPGTQEMINNTVIEKYCYNNKVDSCTKYGGLYQWDEMMQYANQQVTQGICPPNWHIPSDEEWKVLEGVVDSQLGVGDTNWDNYDLRGFDAGLNLKSSSRWYYGGNGTDLFDFSCFPGGLRAFDDGYFYQVGMWGLYWSSTETYTTGAWYRWFSYGTSGVTRRDYSKLQGQSVRCIMDY